MTFYADALGSCRPGDVPRMRTYASSIVELPVRPGQVIKRGDIVTLPALEGPVEPRGAALVESIGDDGVTRNWGDVSQGAFMALHGTGSPRGAGDHVEVRAMPASGEITTLLDAGIAVGSLVGVDLRIDDGARRVDRSSAVTGGRGSPGESGIAQLWQRARLMTPDQAGDPALRKAFLGRVKRIPSARAGKPAQKSRHNDCGVVSSRM